MVKIKQQLVSQDVINKRSYGAGNPSKFITIHETGNVNEGAGAQSHADLQSRINPREASWHYQVDDKEIIQSFPDEVRCWHAGDGRGKGNNESIAIEICVNSDGDFRKAVQNAAKLTQHLMEKHNIPINNVVQHNHWSGKNCPQYLRAGNRGYTWDGFIALVKTKPSDDTFTLSKDVSGHVTAADAKSGKNKKTTVSAGVYYIYKEHDGMLNLTKTKGVPGSWINPGAVPVANKPAPKTFKVGQKVKVKKTAQKYANVNKAIPDWVKGKSYTIMQVNNDRVLLKEIMSWVNKTDVE